MTYESCTDELTTYKNESLLEAKGISKSYVSPDGHSNLILKDFSLSIHDLYGKPQVVAILGQSGSGKTTALRILAGLESPDIGTVTLSNGLRDAEHQMRSVNAGDVGVVFQKYSLFDHLTVFRNLIDPALFTGTLSNEAETKALIYLKAFEMENYCNHYPSQLSGGMRQRVAIIQQLMVEKHFLVLDEPFSGLDVKNLQLVLKMLQNTARMHTLNTFIIVTHDVTNALIIADTVYVLGREKIDGQLASGSKIVKEYDLIAEGLAYRENIETLPRFEELRKELKYEIIPNV